MHRVRPGFRPARPSARLHRGGHIVLAGCLIVLGGRGSALAAQAPHGVVLTAGYAHHSYGRGSFSFEGLKVGIDIPFGRVVRFAARGYHLSGDNEDQNRGWTADLGLAIGPRARWADAQVLLGLSAVGVDSDYVGGGFAGHFGLQGHVWAGQVGLFGEGIYRSLFSGDGHVTQFGVGASLRF